MKLDTEEASGVRPRVFQPWRLGKEGRTSKEVWERGAREKRVRWCLEGNERKGSLQMGVTRTRVTVLRRCSMMKPKDLPLDLVVEALGCLDRSCLEVMGRYSLGGRESRENGTWGSDDIKYNPLLWEVLFSTGAEKWQVLEGRREGSEKMQTLPNVS